MDSSGQCGLIPTILSVTVPMNFKVLNAVGSDFLAALGADLPLRPSTPSLLLLPCYVSDFDFDLSSLPYFLFLISVTSLRSYSRSGAPQAPLVPNWTSWSPPSTMAHHSTQSTGSGNIPGPSSLSLPITSYISLTPLSLH
jgi:hypothetical protein